MNTQIAIMDLQELKNETQKLKEASKLGCLRLINHGISIKLMDEMKQVVKELHDLPVEIKMKNKDIIPGSGYEGPSEKNPYFEALGLFDVGSSKNVDHFCSQLQVSSHQREIIEMYAHASHKLAVDLASKLAKSMGLADYSFEGWLNQFKINKYTFTPESIGSIGIQTHTDSGFLTILQDDENIGGLEVMNLSGSFVPVDPMPGSLFVFFGDIAMPWSNGRLRNVQHRVQCKDVGLRYSIATFLAPQADKIVETQPEFIDAEHPRLYSPFTYEEYKKLRATLKLHTGETLEMVRVKKYLSWRIS